MAYLIIAVIKLFSLRKNNLRAFIYKEGPVTGTWKDFLEKVACSPTLKSYVVFNSQFLFVKSFYRDPRFKLLSHWQESQGYRMKPCLEKQNRQTNKRL